MATNGKTVLTWKPINMAKSHASIQKAFQAETVAVDATNAAIAKLAAAAEKVDPKRIKIGRQWGKVSYAVLPEDTGGTSSAAVTLG